MRYQVFMIDDQGRMTEYAAFVTREDACEYVDGERVYFDSDTRVRVYDTINCEVVY